MHIAHVTLAKKLGGGEVQQRLLMRHLAQYPIEQSLICPPAIRDFFTEKPINNLKQVQPIHGLFSGHNKVKADLYHTHCGRSIYWGLIERLLTRKPYIATRRVPDPIKDRFFSRLAYGKADKIVAITQAVAQKLPKNVNQESIAICHSALAQNYQKQPSFKALNTQSPHILQVGNLLTHKGYYTTLEAAEQLAQSHPNITITVLGEAHDPDIASSIEKMPNIQYKGMIQDPKPYYQQADLFIFPSWDEGMGSSLLEAMNHGLPIIASNVGGIPEVIEHNISGLLIQPRSVEALYDAIVTLLEHPEMAQRLGQKAHQKLTDFLPEAMAQCYFNCYKQYLNKL